MALEVKAADKAKYKKFVKCFGAGKYFPWVNVGDVARGSKRVLLFSKKFNRQISLMSLGELDVFIDCERKSNVFQIYEQFALDPDVTTSIAKELKIVHPRITTRKGKIKKAPTLAVMSTDLVVEYVDENGEIFVHAYSYKPKKHLSTRNLKKLDIEQRYWERQGATWYLVTDADYSVGSRRLMMALYENVCLEIDDHTLSEYAKQFTELWLTNRYQSSIWLLLNMPSNPQFMPLELFATAIYKKFLTIDDSQPLHFDYPIVVLRN